MPSESTDYLVQDQPGKFPWRVFWLLLVASVAGVGAAVPMVLELFRELIKSQPPSPLPLPLIIVIGGVQNLALLSLAIGFGLLLAGKLGLGAPLLEGWLYRRKQLATVRGSLITGVLVGLGAGVVILIPILIAAPYLPGLPFVSAARVALWKRLLTGFYGGIVEEVFSRLFLMSLVAWLGTKLFQKQKVGLSSGVFWTANVIVAILFGLGHLPAASLVMHITPAVVVLALFLNGIPAICFGYLFWKRGLESAMIAHFAADFVVWVIGPALLKTS
jgi:membrane protease YdiL (CAAX protease family)